MTDIYVIDTETTGLRGHPYDSVVEIGICRVSPEEGTVDPFFSSLVGYDTEEWPECKKESWIFQNTSITLEQVQRAPPLGSVVSRVRKLLAGKDVNSYNEAYDFGKFLYSDPWNLDDTVRLLPCIMVQAHSVESIPRNGGRGGWVPYPKLESAYRHLCPDDPAGLEGEQDHRALSDAVLASYVMLRLMDIGRYPLSFPDPEGSVKVFRGIPVSG